MTAPCSQGSCPRSRTSRHCSDPAPVVTSVEQGEDHGVHGGSQIKGSAIVAGCPFFRGGKKKSSNSEPQ